MPNMPHAGEKRNGLHGDTTKRNPFLPHVSYGPGKRRVTRAPDSVGKVALWKTTKTRHFAHEVSVEKPCEKAHRQPVKEGKQTTRKSETRALYAPIKHHKNRAFGPKQHPKFHFIDKRKEAFYNQTIWVTVC